MSRSLIIGACLLLAGCYTVVNTEEGVPFLGREVNYNRVIQVETVAFTQLAVGLWTLEDFEEYLLKQAPGVKLEKLFPDRRARISRQAREVSKTWRFLMVKAKTFSVPVKSWRDFKSWGYEVTGIEVNGVLSEVRTSVFRLTKKQEEWSTKHAVLAGVGAAGTAILLAGS